MKANRMKRKTTVALMTATALALALAMPAAASASSTVVERDGATAETVITGKVGRAGDLISVVLPASISMSIKTDKQGRLDKDATKDVEVDVVNESKSTFPIDIELYETVDDDGLLSEVNLHLNGQNINRAVGGASGEINLLESLAPGSTEKLVLSATSLGANQIIREGARSVKTTVKATIA